MSSVLGVSNNDWDIFCEAGWLLDVDLVLYRDEDVKYELVILTLLDDKATLRGGKHFGATMY